MKWHLIRQNLAAAGLTKRGAVLVLTLGLMLLTLRYTFGTVRHRVHQTCIKCRAGRCINTIAGIDFTRTTPSELTPIYDARFPAHEHVWTRSSCYRGFGLAGNPTYFGCGPMHPIRSVSPAFQKWFVESASQAEVEKFYAGVLSNDRNIQKATVEDLWKKLGLDETSQARVSSDASKSE